MFCKKYWLVVCAGGLVMTTQAARADDNNPPPQQPPQQQPAQQQPAENGPQAQADPAPSEPVSCEAEPSTCPNPTAPAAAPQAEYPAPPPAHEEGCGGEFGYCWHDPHMYTGIGVSFMLGGGVTGFTDSTLRNSSSSSVGGLWNFRATIGSRVPIGIDLSYVGSAASIQTLGGFDNGTLIQSSAEADLRWNILPQYVVNPYIFGGAGYTNYHVHNMHFSTADSGIESNANVASFPVGLGIGYHDLSGLVIEARGTFRFTTTSDMVLDTNGSNADLWSWDATGAIGYEF